jgi:hypothetical protein
MPAWFEQGRGVRWSVGELSGLADVLATAAVRPDGARLEGMV